MKSTARQSRKPSPLSPGWNPRRRQWPPAHAKAGGVAVAEDRPTPGWKGHSHIARIAFINPRAPAVPATLDLTLAEYFACGTLIGLIAAQVDEPDPDWLQDYSLDMGEQMARKARARRKKQR